MNDGLPKKTMQESLFDCSFAKHILGSQTHVDYFLNKFELILAKFYPVKIELENGQKLSSHTCNNTHLLILLFILLDIIWQVLFITCRLTQLDLSKWQGCCSLTFCSSKRLILGLGVGRRLQGVQEKIKSLLGQHWSSKKGDQPTVHKYCAEKGSLTGDHKVGRDEDDCKRIFFLSWNILYLRGRNF